MIPVWSLTNDLKDLKCFGVFQPAGETVIAEKQNMIDMLHIYLFLIFEMKLSV